MTDTLATDGPAPVDAAAPPVGGRPTDGHLWQIDIVRLLTFAAVIWVHSLAFTTLPDDGFAAGLMMVLQFGREVFFALTGFVLVYASLGRPLKALPFWRRRFLFVGLPYVVWSVLYYLFGLAMAPHATFSWHTLGVDLIDGNAEYHLYFLLVSMQLYLVFPLLVRLIKRTAHRPWPVIAVVGVLNAVWLADLQWLPWPHGWYSVFWTHGYELLPTYSIYVLLGCYAAVHRERLLELLRAHRRRVAAFAVSGLVLIEVAYGIQAIWMPVRSANSPVQPVMIIGSVSVALLLLMAGDAWACGRRRGLRAVKRASEVSFGVYLCHPMVLTLLDRAGLGNGANHLPQGTATVLAFFGTATGAVLVGLALRRTPLALPLIGRSRARDGAPRPRRPVPSSGRPAGDGMVQTLFRSH